MFKFRVKRAPEGKAVRNEFETGANHVLIVLPGNALAIGDASEIEVEITPIQTREERLREARFAALATKFPLPNPTASQALAIIERVDAEFAKENPG